MNLRTITGWAIYDPKRKVIVTMKPLKKLAKPSKYPGCVLVKMKGHYVLPSEDSRGSKLTLKPCPFCGSQAKEMTTRKVREAGCTRCGVTTGINLWNCRGGLDKLEAPLPEALEKIGPNGEDAAKLKRIVSAYICANNYINAMADSSVLPDSLEKIRQTYYEAVRVV